MPSDSFPTFDQCGQSITRGTRPRPPLHLGRTPPDLGTLFDLIGRNIIRLGHASLPNCATPPQIIGADSATTRKGFRRRSNLVETRQLVRAASGRPSTLEMKSTPTKPQSASPCRSVYIVNKLISVSGRVFFRTDAASTPFNRGHCKFKKYQVRSKLFGGFDDIIAVCGFLHKKLCVTGSSENRADRRIDALSSAIRTVVGTTSQVAAVFNVILIRKAFSFVSWLPMPTKKPKTKKPGTVRKIIKPLVPNEPEKAEIEIRDAEDLYKEIRIENALTDSEGKKVKLKPNAEVDVTIEADKKDTLPKNEKE